nr:hypothetical protein [Tanacetum cinerariifolium]
MSSLGVRELLISLIILVKSSSLLQSLILLATSSFIIDFISVNGHGDSCLGIFGVDEVAIVGDMLYGIGFCGIPCKRANAEHADLVIELYVGVCGVKAMNLF